MATARDFTVTYGSQTVGGNGTSVTYPITGRLSTTESHDSFECQFSFFVFGTGPSDFEGNLATVRSAFRKPNQNLTISVGDTQTRDTWYTFNHQTGTGFDSFAEITKDESEEDSGLCQRLTVRIQVQLPADTLGSANGQLGRRSSTVTVDTAPSGRRRLTIDGVYTATTSNTTAIDQYETVIGAYVSAVQAAYDSSATWELVEEFTNAEDTAVSSVSPTAAFGKGKICTFRRAYEELLFHQGQTASSASPNDSEIRQQRFRMQASRFNRDNVGQLGSPTESDRLLVTYTCEVVTSKTGSDLVTKYETDIRPFLYDESRSLTGVQGLVIFREDVEYNVDENQITATMEIGGFPGGINVARVEIEDAFSDTGQTLVPIYTGDPLDYYVFQGPQVRTRSILIEEFVTGLDGGEEPLPRGGFVNPPQGVVKSHSVRHVPTQNASEFGKGDRIRFFNGRRITQIEIQYFSAPGDSSQVSQPLNELPGAPGG